MMENEIILKKIKDDESLNEISKDLTIGSKETYKKIMALKNNGYLISEDIYDDGEIRFKFSLEKEKSNTINILLSDENKFRALVISDLHVGNEFENLSYLDKAYDYARDNDINIILNGGDIIDGDFSRGNQNISNPLEQFQKLIKCHPFDKHILNLICMGNHDYSMYDYNIDIQKALVNERPDLIPIGYSVSLINIAKDQFVIRHPAGNTALGATPNKLVLKGHHHKMGLKINNDNFYVFIPTLSDLYLGKDQNPGMIDMKLSLENGYIHTGEFTHYIIKNKPIHISENYLEFFFKHTIINEDDIIPKKLQKKTRNF